MTAWLDRLRAGETLLMDGAIGTLLAARGLERGTPPDAWNLTRPDDVRAAFAAYVAAGSDIIESNSFGGTHYKLAHSGLGERVAEVNRAAARLSREAAGDGVLVAASVGPTGRIPDDEGGDTSYGDLLAAFSAQVVALAEGGAQAFCIETMSSVTEALAAIRAAVDETGLPVICTFTFSTGLKGARTMMGATPADAARAALDEGATVVGANCSSGIADLIPVCADIRAALPTALTAVQANAGRPVLRDGVTVFVETPEVTVSHLPALLAAGANIVGGCCGTTPAHIAALRAALDAGR